MPPPRRTFRRPLLRAAAFALAGLSTTLAVALLGPLVLRLEEFTATWHPSWSRGASAVYTVTLVRISGAADDDPAVLRQRASALVRAARFERGAAPLVGFAGRGPVDCMLYESGWPATAFTGWSIDGPTGPFGIPEKTSLVVKTHSPRNDPWLGRVPITLPLLPHWPGVSINTATFGVAWWGLLALAGLSRRAIRRRGRCVRCGYSLAGLPVDAGECPECGADAARGPRRRAGAAPPR